MKKRILSLMLAFVMTASMVNVAMAAEEKNINVSSPLEMKYPTADITPEFVEANFSKQGNYILNPTPAGVGTSKGSEVLPVNVAREFKLKLKNDKEISYLLLDKDSAGNYFIVQKTPVMDTGWKYYKGSGDCTANLTTANVWKFDFTVSDSRASYLNDYSNGYLTPAKNYFAPELNDYLVEKDWSVGADSSRDYTGENSEWSSNKRTNNPAYTTCGKVALLSAQEYITYLDILGYIESGDNGIALRTPASRAYKSGETTAYSCGPLKVYNTGNNVVITYGPAPNSQKLNPQVCFWVNPEFFKEVKLEAAGADVVAEMQATTSAAELISKGTYTAEELATLGYSDPVNAFSVTHNFEGDISELTEVTATTTIENTELQSAFVVLAAYDNSGRMIGCDAEIITSVDKKITASGLTISDITKGTLKNIKIMVWDSIDGMRPIVSFDSDNTVQ